MSVVIQFEEAGPWKKRLTIEVPAPAVEAETGRVIKQLGQSINLPGFRKGKIPASIIQKRFSSEVERRVTEVLVPRYWNQAEAEKSLDALTQPQVEDVRFEPGAPMRFVAVVETRPEIELKNVDDFTLPEGDVEPSADDVNQALTDLRRRFAAWKPVDRPAARGDVVQGEVVRLAGEEAESPGEAERQPLRIEIGADGVDEELSLALTGLAPGQSTTFRRRPGAGAEDRPAEFRIEVSGVEEIELAELDDDLAVKLGATDAAKLEDDVRGQLRAIRRMELEKKRDAALLEQLRERHPMELPQGVVEQEVDRMFQDQLTRLAAQGVDLEHAPIDWEAMRSQLRPQAQKRVHSSLLLEAVARAKNLKLDEAEFERFLSTIAREQKKSSLAVRQELDQSGRLPLIRAQLLESQALRHLLSAGEGPAGAGDEFPLP
jgi:trigger factor